MNKKHKKGFTLIEVLVVVSIIGILASIMLVGLGGFRAKGRDARRIADLRQVQNVLELYFSKCGYYPGGATLGVCNTTNPASWADLKSSLVSANIGVTAIANDPLAPAQNYVYGPAGASPQNYVLQAALEDTNNSALKDDVDVITYTVDCADPKYCIQF